MTAILWKFVPVSVVTGFGVLAYYLAHNHHHILGAMFGLSAVAAAIFFVGMIQFGRAHFGE